MDRSSPEEFRKLKEIASKLNLPAVVLTTGSGGDHVMVSMKDLWELLSDEKKLRELMSRVKNKAFW